MYMTYSKRAKHLALIFQQYYHCIAVMKGFQTVKVWITKKLWITMDNKILDVLAI